MQNGKQCSGWLGWGGGGGGEGKRGITVTLVFFFSRCKGEVSCVNQEPPPGCMQESDMSAVSVDYFGRKQSWMTESFNYNI